MPRQTISEAIEARLAFLERSQEERDLRLVVDELVGAGFTGSIATAYTLLEPRGLDIEITIQKSLKPEYAKSLVLLVEVEEGTRLDIAYRYFPVCQREELLDYIISEINSARLL